MKFFGLRPINFFLSLCPKAAFYVALAMFLGGPKVCSDIYEMTSELLRVSSRADFHEWVIHAQIKLVNATKIDWKPIVMFPEETKRFK
jgi:hypothetical protein